MTPCVFLVRRKAAPVAVVAGLDCLLDDVDPIVDLRGFDDERWREAQRVRPGRDDEHAVLATAIDDGRDRGPALKRLK